MKTTQDQPIKMLSVDWTPAFYHVLNSISRNLRNHIDKTQNSDEMFTILFSKVFDNRNFNTLYNQLKRMVQTDIITIDPYYQQIIQIHREIALTTGQSEEANRRANEGYYMN